MKCSTAGGRARSAHGRCPCQYVSPCRELNCRVRSGQGIILQNCHLKEHAENFMQATVTRPEPARPRRALAWGLRLLVLGGIAILCVSTRSAGPAFAFVMAWGANYPVLAAAGIGILRLPRALHEVHAVEPVIYRWAGVGIAKWVVTRRAWSLLVGLQPPAQLVNREDILNRVDFLTKGAEVCHGAAFIFASMVALLCLVLGWSSGAAWTFAFNVVLNGYPVMLQRSNRWRLQVVRDHRHR